MYGGSVPMGVFASLRPRRRPRSRTRLTAYRGRGRLRLPEFVSLALVQSSALSPILASSWSGAASRAVRSPPEARLPLLSTQRVREILRLCPAPYFALVRGCAQDDQFGVAADH